MPQLLTAHNLSLGAEANGNHSIKSKLARASHSEASGDRINDDLSTMSLVSDVDNLSESGTQRDRSRPGQPDEYILLSTTITSLHTLLKLPITYDEVIDCGRALLSCTQTEYLVCPVTLSIDFAGEKVSFDDLDWGVVRHGSRLIIEANHGSVVRCSPSGNQVILHKFKNGFHENYYYRTKPGETVGEFMRRIRGRSGSSLLQYRLCAPGSSIYLDDDELMTYSSVKVVRFR